MNVNLKATLIWAVVMVAFALIAWGIKWMVDGDHHVLFEWILASLMAAWIWAMIRVGLT
jgi:hypothetical protein